MGRPGGASKAAQAAGGRGIQRRWRDVANMASHAIFQYNVLAIDDTHNIWTNMIVKMTILRLLGSSDDKEKIGVARPMKNPSRKDQDEANLLSPVKPMMSKFVLIGAMNLAPD